MVAKLYSATVIGVDAYPIEIEVNLTGVSSVNIKDSTISIVGLPDTAVKESRDRIYSAFINSNFMPPRGFTVVNLAPADLRKEGAAFDLGIALALLGTTGNLDIERLGRIAALGELALDGSLRPVKGALPIAEEISATELSLPIYYGMPEEEIDYVIEAVNQFEVNK